MNAKILITIGPHVHESDEFPVDLTEEERSPRVNAAIRAAAESLGVRIPK